MNDLETKIRQDKQTRTEPDSMNKSMSRRNFGKTLLTLTAGAILKSCTKHNNGPSPIGYDTYYITAEGRSICEGLPLLSGAEIRIGNQTISSGGTVAYNAKENGSTIELNMTGGHNAVLCIRAPDGSSNLTQSQSGNPAYLNLESLGSNAKTGDQVYLVLYKIPSNINITAVKEALSKGTAVYQQAVTFHPVNEGYPEEDYNTYKTGIVKNKADNILNQINNIYGIPGCNYDPNQTTGNQEIRLSPSYINPGHGESGSGVMTASCITITAHSEYHSYVEELYQAMGVRHDIGADCSLADDICDNTATLNQFGRDLMLINYFLSPGTIL